MCSTYVCLARSRRLACQPSFSEARAATTMVAEKSQENMRFPVYESLYFLNRSVQDLLLILEEIKKSPGMPRKSFEAYQVEIQYLRSQATQDVLEVMNDTEIDEMAQLGKKKKAYDDRIRDLDDVYFEVQRREEQRRKQGLPSLIGVLPLNYEPPVSQPREPDDETVTSGASQDVHFRNRIKSRTRSSRGRKAARNSRSRRLPERAS